VVGTERVEMVNVPVAEPALMTADDGTFRLGLVDVSVRVMSLGAVPLRVAVPTPACPPTIALGLETTALRTGGLMVRGSLMEVAESETVILAVVVVETAVVVTVKFAVDFPEGMMTVAGTVAEVESEATHSL
jgi:hypothetical protein